MGRAIFKQVDVSRAIKGAEQAGYRLMALTAFKQRDVSRAIKGAEAAGFSVCRVEIAKDGTIVVTDPALQHALTQTARDAYILLGGQFGDWGRGDASGDWIRPATPGDIYPRFERKVLVGEPGDAQETD